MVNPGTLSRHATGKDQSVLGCFSEPLATSCKVQDSAAVSALMILQHVFVVVVVAAECSPWELQELGN